MRPLVIGLATATILASGIFTAAAAKGGGPPRMALSADGRTAAVTARWSLFVYQIGKTAAQTVQQIQVQQDLSPIALHGPHIAVAGTHYTTKEPQEQVLLYTDLDDPAPAVPIRLNHRVTDLQFSPNGETLAIASWDSMVRFWDLDRGEITLSLAHDSGIVQALQYSPDGAILATAGENGVILWDTATGERLSAPVASSLANCLAFDPTGSRLLVGNDRERAAIMLVDTDTGEILAYFDHTVAPSQMGINGAYATGVAFAPNGRTFASSALDGTVRLWDGASLELIAERQFDTAIYAIEFDPSGSTLVAYGTSEGPTLHLWSMPPPQPTAITPTTWAKLKQSRSAAPIGP